MPSSCASAKTATAARAGPRADERASSSAMSAATGTAASRVFRIQKRPAGSAAQSKKKGVTRQWSASRKATPSFKNGGGLLPLGTGPLRPQASLSGSMYSVSPKLKW